MAALAAVLVSMAGCGADDRGEAPTGQAEDPAGAGAPGTTLDSEIGTEDEASGPEGGETGFVASGEIRGGEAGAADRIEGVRFRIFDGYERLLMDFGRDGGPAGVPRWSVESPAEGGYVRLRFPGVASTEITDEDFVGSVLGELYVVRNPDGGISADVFALHAFLYRVTELPGSGRLALDFRGVREELDLPPTTGARSVVLQPREAEEVGSPLNVRGYSRHSGKGVTVSLLDREREIIASKTVRAGGRGAAAWEPFGTTLGFSGHEGLATLRVGGRGSPDGPLAGTEVEVFVE